MKGPVKSLEVTYLVHATEDPEKLARAVGKVFSNSPLEVEEMEGHYGNAIARVRMHVTGDEAQRAFRRMVSGLGSDERAVLLGSLGAHLDEHRALFVRFDKQGLTSGVLRLGSADPVRVKVKPAPFLKGVDAPAFYAKLFREV